MQAKLVHASFFNEAASGMTLALKDDRGFWFAPFNWHMPQGDFESCGLICWYNAKRARAALCKDYDLQ